MKRLIFSLALLSSDVLLPAAAAEPPASLAPCCRKAPTNAPPTEGSLYQLESLWTSDLGVRVPLATFGGRIQVLALFFSRCEYACPILVQDLKRLQEALPASVRDEVDFVLVSLDSERDTPETLAAYRREQRLGTDHWALLTGSADDVRELAALLGVNFRKDGRGQFAHPNLYTVLNGRGELLRQQIGLQQDPAPVVAAIRQALEPARP